MKSRILEAAKQNKYVYTALILIISTTALLYSQVSDFSFITYDDDKYILENEDIRNISTEGIAKIFFNPEKPEEMKPPITVLSLAVNYHFSKLDPGSYHLTNLFLHLFNIVLVFILVRTLSPDPGFALFAAGVFALHPSSAEAVAWVTARKELLYGLFYLAALIFAFKFWKTRRPVFYFLVLLFFVLSYYSKYAAASFPVLYLVLALLYYGRKDVWRTAAESIPLFILPIHSFYLSFGNTWSGEAVAETASNTTDKTVIKAGIMQGGGAERASEVVAPVREFAQEVTAYGSFDFIQKIFLGGYSFLQYLIKFIFPRDHQLLYPYPPIDKNGSLPDEYYFAATVSLLIAGAVLYLFIKRKELLSKEIGFGVLFFAVTVALLLHILPIGGRVVIADRYMYLPYIGLSIVLYFLLKSAAKRFNLPKLPAITGVAYILVLAYQLNDRIPDWHDSETVFTDLIEKGVHSPVPYNNLGILYQNEEQYDKALKYLNRSLEFDASASNADAVNNRGSVLLNLGRPREALRDFKHVIKHRPDYTVAIYNAGTVYDALKMPDSALYYYKKTLEQDPGHHLSLNNYGVIYMDYEKNYKKAEKYYRRALEAKPDFARAYNNIGIVYRLGYENIDSAFYYFKRAVETDPDFLDGYLNMGRIYQDKQQHDNALEMFNYIISKDPDYAHAYFSRGIIYLRKGDRNAGCNELSTAYNKGFTQAEPFIRKFCRGTP